MTDLSDWAIPLATFILAVPPAAIALYRSCFRDHAKMMELEGRIGELERDLMACKLKNSELVEENFRLLKKVVEGPADCPAGNCPLALHPKPVKRHSPGSDSAILTGSEYVPTNAPVAS